MFFLTEFEFLIKSCQAFVFKTIPFSFWKIVQDFCILMDACSLTSLVCSGLCFTCRRQCCWYSLKVSKQLEFHSGSAYKWCLLLSEITVKVDKLSSGRQKFTDIWLVADDNFSTLLLLYVCLSPSVISAAATSISHLLRWHAAFPCKWMKSHPKDIAPLSNCGWLIKY